MRYPKKPMQSALIVALLTIFLLAACGSQPAGSPDAAKMKAMPQDFQKEKALRPVHSAAQPKEPAGPEVRRAKFSSPDPVPEDAPKDQDLEKVDWGREITLNGIIAMAQKGQIQEIEWHVMPNIIRILASDGSLFHFRNENKGVDLRNTLINAGIRIGKGGIVFRHVF
jgi:hypothetical protein